jgi:prephenate dehydrogenase
MRKFHKITIIGVGLIGGSIGLAVKRRRLAREVTGVFRRPSTLRRALKRGAIDSGTLDIKEGVRGAGLIIIASPVLTIPGIARKALGSAKSGAIVTDVGSSKGWIVSEIEKMEGRCRGVHFVGSHPMAGSEQAGVEAARSGLFEGAPCIVTKTARTDRRALKTIVEFWRSLGARVEMMNPVEHDRSVALVSHLPHIVAFGLAGSVPAHSLKYGAEGFKDTTRVASSDPKLWADIFLTNRSEILRAGRIFERYYKKILKAISCSDYAKIVKLLASAKAKRDRFSYPPSCG